MTTSSTSKKVLKGWVITPSSCHQMFMDKSVQLPTSDSRIRESLG